MNFDLDYIEKLVKLLDESQLSEMILQDGEQVVELHKNKDIQTITVPAQAAPVIVPQAPIVSEPVSVNVEKEQNVVDIKATNQSQGKAIKSPMVGVFYTSPSPDAAPYVSIGDTVSTGQVICIIEAMKMMNEIEAEVSGKVVKVCVENGQPVEYGQVLMYVE